MVRKHWNKAKVIFMAWTSPVVSRVILGVAGQLSICLGYLKEPWKKLPVFKFQPCRFSFQWEFNPWHFVDCWPSKVFSHSCILLVIYFFMGHTCLLSTNCLSPCLFILSPCLFNLYAEYIMRNTGLDEAQTRIKIAGRNINSLRYADDTTLMAESEEELKSLLVKVK